MKFSMVVAVSFFFRFKVVGVLSVCLFRLQVAGCGGGSSVDVVEVSCVAVVVVVVVFEIGDAF